MVTEVNEYSLLSGLSAQLPYDNDALNWTSERVRIFSEWIWEDIDVLENYQGKKLTGLKLLRITYSVVMPISADAGPHPSTCRGEVI